jgi:hypothetical protein
MRHRSVLSRLRDWQGRSAWAEWGPFVVAALLAAGLLIVFALTSPIFRGPAPLPESDPSAAKHASASSDQDPPESAGEVALPNEPPP